jgi:hypothetical protein
MLCKESIGTEKQRAKQVTQVNVSLPPSSLCSLIVCAHLQGPHCDLRAEGLLWLIIP